MLMVLITESGNVNLPILITISISTKIRHTPNHSSSSGYTKDSEIAHGIPKQQSNEWPDLSEGLSSLLQGETRTPFEWGGPSITNKLQKF